MTWRVRAGTFDAHAGDVGSADGSDELGTGSFCAASGLRGEDGALHDVERTARQLTATILSDPRSAPIQR